jgi:pyruvate dehydrogenase E2 component (dihydrolipoamide acetyltransferase)
MPIPITIPRLGWNMEEGVFVEWLKADGDTVKAGDRLYRLEGEKSVEEIESFDAGVLSIPTDAPRPGDSVKVGAVIGQLLQAGESRSAEPARQVSKGLPPDPAASPSVRRMARERGIDLGAVSGSGPGGRIIHTDLSEPTISPRAKRLAERQGVDWKQLQGSGRSGRIRERDIPAPPLLARRAPHLRSAIASKMLASKNATAPVTLTSIVDAANLVNLREQFKSTGEVVPSFTDFLIKLAAAALEKHPQLAAQWTDDEIRFAERIDIGFAVDSEVGLLVPVIRDVPALGLRQVATRSRELVELVRDGKLTSRDMGGCFTITNLGAFGIDAFTPIINYPECAILGVGRIERRPVMDGDRVVGREQLTLSLTFDHRIVDGAPAARLLQTLAQMIANPGPWLST